MSRRDNMSRIYVGNLPPDVRTRDLEDIFYKFGKIAFIDLKTRRGPPFAFVEFVDYRDAQDAVRSRDGKEFDGYRLRVEFPRGSERRSNYNRNGASKSSRSGGSSGGGGGGAGGGPPQRRSKHRVLVTGLPPSGSWQDLKDHMREIGEVCFADVYKGGEGVVEFLRYDDMKYALKKMNNTKFKSHEGETTYIRLREDSGGDVRSRSRSRSRSITPIAKKRGSPSYSPARKRSPSDSRSRSRSRSRTRSRSRSVTRSRSRSAASRSRSRTPASRSRSRSRTRSRTRSRSRSRTPSRSKSRSKTPSRSRSRSRSVSRSRSRSRSPTRSKSLSKTPEIDRKPSLSPEAKRPSPEPREANDDQ